MDRMAKGYVGETLGTFLAEGIKFIVWHGRKSGEKGVERRLIQLIGTIEAEQSQWAQTYYETPINPYEKVLSRKFDFAFLSNR